MDELTKEQQCAMKPWVITAFVASIVRLVAICLFCLYLFRSPRPNIHAVIIWMAAIIFIPHFVVVICSRRVSHVTGIKHREGLWLLSAISILLFAALAYLTW